MKKKSLFHFSSYQWYLFLRAINKANEGGRRSGRRRLGWLVVLGLTALSDSISVYIGPSPKERKQVAGKGEEEKGTKIARVSVLSLLLYST